MRQVYLLHGWQLNSDSELACDSDLWFDSDSDFDIRRSSDSESDPVDPDSVNIFA